MIGNYGPFVTTVHFFNTLTNFSQVEQAFVRIVECENSEDGSGDKVGDVTTNV